MTEIYTKSKEVVIESQWRVYLLNNKINILPLMGDWDSGGFEVDNYDWVALVKIAIEIASSDFYRFPLLLGFDETSPFEADVLLAQEVNEIWQIPPKKVKFLSDAEIEALPQDFMERTEAIPLAWREVEDILIGELPFHDPKIGITEVNSIMESLRRIRSIEGEEDEMYLPAKGLLSKIRLGFIDDAPCYSLYSDDCPAAFRWAELVLINQGEQTLEWLGIVKNPPVSEEDQPLFFVGKWVTNGKDPFENWINYKGLLAIPGNKGIYHWRDVKMEGCRK